MTAEGGEKAECKVITYPIVHALGKYGDEDVDTFNLLFNNATWERSVPTVSRNNIGIIFSESTNWTLEDIQVQECKSYCNTFAFTLTSFLMPPLPSTFRLASLVAEAQVL